MLSGIVLGNFIQSTYSTYFHTSTIPSIGNYAHQTQNFDNPFIHFQNISLCEHLSDDWSRDREVHCCLQASPLQTSPNWQLQVHLIVTQQFDMWLILFRSERLKDERLKDWVFGVDRIYNFLNFFSKPYRSLIYIAPGVLLGLLVNGSR